jgi:glycosyltransferase involved in cell wall biosynthesis
MTNPRITIVTPSYNQGQFLEETISSVLDQGYTDLEYMVLDGGSTDGSQAIIDRYANHLAYWRSRPDDGQAAALKEGFSRATGDILGWLNSDDLLAPGALDRVAQTWQEHGPDILIAGACEVFDESGSRPAHTPSFQRAYGVPEAMPLASILDMPRHWFRGEYFYQPEVFFPRNVYEAVGGVDPSIYYTMDYDLWVRFALAATPVVVVPEVLAKYREHSGQKTHDRSSLQRQMVETANRYLRAGNLPLSLRHRFLLMTLNRVAVLPPVLETARVISRSARRFQIA